MSSLKFLPALVALLMLFPIVPARWAGPPARQSATDWFFLYLPYVLGIIALIILVVYSIREEILADVIL